ncbi:putative glycosyltransferase, cell wall biogenesis [Acetobacter senegalensis]|uniref:Putative glycosyltransferase, cell wall biogenesis n=1 Tax=Acetobacter senegalensis TaxID=446692 RepID=A0A0U5ERW1_9PROT|nr:hypothetical protein [Acetobacter senegalensis]CEF40410.1 putative glycosyltransferase, cell wall biogenesis [Acetobacter senegalensis]
MNSQTPLPHYPIHHLLMPNLEFGTPATMYARVHDREGTILFSENTIILEKFGRCSFDTFYNGLTIQSWKENCAIQDLAFFLTGTGKVVIRLGVHRLGCDQRFLVEQKVTLDPQTPVQINVEEWPTLINGMLYAQIEALDEASITGGWFATSTPPERDIKLGIVITHFKRENAVRKATRRIQSGLAAVPEIADKIQLTVVDNSCTLTDTDVHGATLIPNRNLGGSGGFTRGLLALKDNGTVTHCLFMDDDASCELEAIFRTYTLLSYASVEKVAVAGALLRELAPHFLFEKGAQFDGKCRPLKHGLDMRSVHDLLLSEVEVRRPDFGGWWFFAFALADVQHYAFPFFVRGDDIMFGMMNKFRIITQNGIASYGDDFGYKSGPFQIYLDVRNHLVQKLTHMNASAADCIHLLNDFFRDATQSYNYATACAISIAVMDVMKGPDFWVENIDMSQIRKKFAPLVQQEKMRKVALPDLPAPVDQIPGQWQERIRRRVVRKLSLNGLLLPEKLRKNSILLQRKNFAGDPRETFRYKNVLYYYEPTQEGYVVHRDTARLLKETKFFHRVKKEFKARYAALQSDYQARYLDMSTEAFWRNVYKNDITKK